MKRLILPLLILASTCCYAAEDTITTSTDSVTTQEASSKQSRRKERKKPQRTPREKPSYCNYHDVYDIFRGHFAGVTVVGTDIIIRGMGSAFASNAALVVVDGVPYSGSLYSINPCDIDRISILKDSSASIYGVRGANGVVLINLKNSTY